MIQINDEELAAINRAMMVRFGIDFSNYESKSFKRRLSRVVEKFGFESVFDLWHNVLRDPNFLTTFIDEITVGLTEMFRNPDLWQKLITDVLPHLSSPKLRVWHAGCSTGEEVFTFAIALKEAHLLANTTAWATDLNSQAVVTAQNGIFGNETMPTFAKNYKVFNPNGRIEKYFTQGEKTFTMAADLNKHVTYLRHNLARDPVNQKFDIIFCRNVMIYFDDVLKMQVLKLFYDHLADDGFLVIGYYDSLPPEKRKYFKIYSPSLKIFRRLPTQV